MKSETRDKKTLEFFNSRVGGRVGKYVRYERNYIAISVLAVLLYIGFGELIGMLSSEPAKSVIGASVSVIFVIMTTMYMLNKQTEMESKRAFDDELLKNKLRMYDEALTVWGKYSGKQVLNEDESKHCIEILLKLMLMAPMEVIDQTKLITDVLINNDQQNETEKENKTGIGAELVTFADLARTDLGIRGVNRFDPEYMLQVVDYITENDEKSADDQQGATGSKSARNRDKFKFKGEKLGKGPLVREVVKYVIEMKNIASFEDLEKVFPPELASDGKKGKGGKNAYVVKPLEMAKSNNLRHFPEIIVLKNKDKVVVGNQWGNNFDHFLNKIKDQVPDEIVRIEG